MKCPHEIPHEVAFRSFPALFYFKTSPMHDMIFKLCLKINRFKLVIFQWSLKASLGIGQLKDFLGMHNTVTSCSAITCFLLRFKCPFFLLHCQSQSTSRHRTWAQGVPSGLLLPTTSAFPSELKCQFFRKTSINPQTHKPNGSPTLLHMGIIWRFLSNTDAWFSLSKILFLLFQGTTWASAFLRTPRMQQVSSVG